MKEHHESAQHTPQTLAARLTYLEWRVQTLERCMSQLKQGVVLISPTDGVIYASLSSQKMFAEQDGLILAGQALKAIFPHDDIRLQTAIQTLLIEKPYDENGLTQFVHRTGGKQPFQLTISLLTETLDQPVAADAEKIVMILVKDLHANQQHWVERLKEHFGLTTREADCVLLLCESRDIREITEILNVSDETVRQHLKRIYKKMDVQKQHELVCTALEYKRKR